MGRSLAIALWLVAGLLASFLGALSGLVGTGAGRELMARVVGDAARNVLDGSVQIGDVGGPLLTGLTLSDVKIFDAEKTLVASVRRVDASYNPLDFVAGRVVLLELGLTTPVVSVVQHKNGRLNVEDVLRLGRPSKGPHGPATLILFRNVRVTDGSVTFRLRTSPEDAAGHEMDPLGPEGPWRIRRFEHLEGRLAAARISSPSEPGIRLDISSLAFTGSDPAVDLQDARGRITIVGDSLQADLDRLVLPASRLAGHGSVRWPHHTLLYDLAIHSDSGTLGDVRFLGLRFPPATVISGDVRLRSHGPRLLEIRLDPLDARYGGGRLIGHITVMTASDSGLIAVHGGDLTAQDMDLDLVRGVVPALPFYGWLSGHTTADGAMNDLTLELGWAFRDSLVPGRPETRLGGNGVVDLRGQDVVFKSFTLERATVDLGSVRQLVPAVTLHGELDGVGNLTGPLHDALFTGTLAHRDGQRPASVLRGAMRLDSRGDTVGVYADVRADSLSFDGLVGSYPSLPLRGTVAGPIRLAGSLAALETHAELASATGGVTADGVLTLLDARRGARGFTLHARNVDLARWAHGMPESRLTFTVTGAVAQDSGATPEGDLQATLAPSLFAGTSFDSGQASVHLANGQISVDSLRLAQPGLVTTGAGALGWRRPTRGALALDFDADSLGALDSLVAWIVGPDVVTATHARSLRGAARVLLSLDGALDSLAIDARASGERLHWRDWEVPAGHAHIAYQPGAEPVFDLDATFDSLTVGEYAFGGAAGRVRGTRDSLTWFARARVGDVGAFLGGGRFRRGGPGPQQATTMNIGVDSLAVLLPGGVWVLQAPAELAVGDSVVDVSGVTFASAAGSGQLVLKGSLPTHGRAEAHLQVEAFPLAGLYALLERDTAGVGGTIGATIGLSGTRSNPVYEGSVSLSNGALGAFRPPFVDGTFSYRDRHLDAALRLWRSGQQILTVTGHLPLDLALVPVAQRQLPDTLAVDARADSVDLSVLEAVTPLLREVQGGFSANVGVAGTWDQPRLRGGLHLAGAAATIPALNVRYTDVTGDLALSGDTIAVRALSARSEKGRMDVSGYMRLTQLTHPELALKITGDRFKALDLKGDVSVTASGNLSLIGPVFGATLTGQATVTSGVLYFADLIEKRIVNLEEFGDTALASLIERQRLGPEFQSVFLDSLHIRSLLLTMGSDVWLRSSEANIQLQGAVTLSKERDNYLLSGTLQAPHGVYRLKVGPVTREFVVSEGTVKYFGTPDLDAALDIQARHTVHPVPGLSQREDIEVTAHITGTLSVPKVTLEADRKDLSQTELISYVLFGKPTFELAGEQGFADQRALVQSAASVLSGSLSGELERTLVSDLGIPLDYVEIRPGAATDPFSGVQLAVGRQLGPRTFLVVNAGFCQGRAVAVGNTIGLSLQYRVSSEFRTQASFEPVRECAADPLTAGSTTAGLRQVGFDLIWERRY